MDEKKKRQSRLPTVTGVIDKAGKWYIAPGEGVGICTCKYLAGV